VQVIRRRESSQELRSIMFTITRPDGAPSTSADLRINLSPNGMHWRDSKGVTFNVGHGLYEHVLARDDIDFVGQLAAYATGGADVVPALVTVEVVPSDEHEKEQPPIYFTTSPPPESALDVMARDWGLSRQIGETDQQFRRRVRAYLGNTKRGTLEDLRQAINEVDGVVRSFVREESAGLVVARVVTTVAHQSLRDQIEQAIDMTRSAGVIVELELAFENGQAWA